jgi:hypothetical protein
MMARAFKVPMYGAAIGAGGFGYANYKLEGGSSGYYHRQNKAGGDLPYVDD